MKKTTNALVVTITEVTKLNPLCAKCRTIVFEDVTEGKKWVKENKSKVINAHFATLIR